MSDWLQLSLTPTWVPPHRPLPWTAGRRERPGSSQTSVRPSAQTAPALTNITPSNSSQYQEQWSAVQWQPSLAWLPSHISTVINDLINTHYDGVPQPPGQKPRHQHTLVVNISLSILIRSLSLSLSLVWSGPGEKWREGPGCIVCPGFTNR